MSKGSEPLIKPREQTFNNEISQGRQLRPQTAANTEPTGNLQGEQRHHDDGRTDKHMQTKKIVHDAEKANMQTGVLEFSQPSSVPSASHTG